MRGELGIEGETAQKIIAQAYNIYVEKGYEGMTLSLIAKKIGIKKPSLYHHFSSKEDIFLSLIEKQFEKLTHFLEREILCICDTYTADELYHEVFKKIIIYIGEDPTKKKFWYTIFFNPPIEFKQEIKTKLNIFSENFMKGMMNTTEIDYLGDTSDEMKRTIIDSFIAYIFGIISLMIYDEELINIEKLEVFWNIFWEGFSLKLKLY